MTALTDFQRLETFGLWHASAREQRRNVIVSLGDATLTISDPNMTALSHWSLPAVERLNPGALPACFGPGPDMPEVLELDDPTMIDAIEKVRGVIAGRRIEPHRLRHLLLAAVVAVAAVGTILWLPGALVRQAVTVVPAAKRVELGEALLADIRRLTGSPCSGAMGVRALDRMRARLLPAGTGRIVVMPHGVRQSEHLPGGLILLDRALVEDHEDPAVAAGHILAQDEAAREVDPLKRLLQQSGVVATMRLLATGRLSDATLNRYAQWLLARGSARPSDAALLARFAQAQVPATPYALALDPTGATTSGLIAADPVPPGAGRPVLPDGDWVGLQGICQD